MIEWLKDKFNSVTGWAKDTASNNLNEPKPLKEWLLQEQAVSDGEIEELKKHNKFAKKIYDETFHAVMEQVKQEANPAQLFAASALDMSPENGAKTIAYGVAKNAAKANGMRSKIGFLWQAFQERWEETDFFTAFFEGLAALFGVKNTITQRATELAMHQVADDTKTFLIDNGLSKEGALTIAQTVFEKGMIDKGLQIPKDHAFAVELKAERDRLLQVEEESKAKNAERVQDHAAEERVRDRDNQVNAAESEVERQQIAESHELTWFESNITGKHEFPDAPELISADLSDFGIPKDEQGAFKRSLYITSDIEDITTLLMKHNPDIKTDNFHHDRYGTAYLQVGDNKAYLDRTGISWQDTRSGLNALAFIGTSFIPGIGWAKNASAAYKTGAMAFNTMTKGTAAGSAYLAMDAYAKEVDQLSDEDVRDALLAGAGEERLLVLEFLRWLNLGVRLSKEI